MIRPVEEVCGELYELEGPMPLTVLMWQWFDSIENILNKRRKIMSESEKYGKNIKNKIKPKNIDNDFIKQWPAPIQIVMNFLKIDNPVKVLLFNIIVWLLTSGIILTISIKFTSIPSALISSVQYMNSKGEFAKVISTVASYNKFLPNLIYGNISDSLLLEKSYAELKLKRYHDAESTISFVVVNPIKNNIRNRKNLLLSMISLEKAKQSYDNSSFSNFKSDLKLSENYFKQIDISEDIKISAYKHLSELENQLGNLSIEDINRDEPTALSHYNKSRNAISKINSWEVNNIIDLYISSLSSEIRVKMETKQLDNLNESEKRFCKC